MARRRRRRTPRSPYSPASWPTWFGLAVIRLASLLPLHWQMRAGHALGRILYALLPGRREVARTNLRLCFPGMDENERERIVRATFASSTMAVFEGALSWWGSERRIARLYSIEGLEHLQAARADGHGVILLGGHYTTLEISGRFLKRHVDGLYPIYKPTKNPVVEKVMAGSRRRIFDGLLVNSDMRTIVRHLRQGDVIWYAPDQDFGRRNTVFAPFMGVPAASLVASARLARLGQARVLPFYSERLADGRYRLRIAPPLENFPSGDDVADAAAVNAAIEQQVRRTPEQYLWVHKRFKTRPPGAPPVYGS